MDYPDYIDENGKVWTHYSLDLPRYCLGQNDIYRQLVLNVTAELSGWSKYVQPDPYQDN